MNRKEAYNLGVSDATRGVNSTKNLEMDDFDWENYKDGFNSVIDQEIFGDEDY